MVSETISFLKDKIAYLEREHRQSVARAKEYRVKADELSQKAEEYQVLLRHLKQWDATESGLIDNNGVTAKSSPSIVELSANDTVPTVPIRQLVTTCLERMDIFSTSKLVAAVQQLDPNAKSNSIQGDLSRRKANGDVSQVGSGVYQSNLFKKTLEQKAETRPESVRDWDENDRLTDPFAEDDNKTSPPPPVDFEDDAEFLTDPFADDDDEEGKKHEHEPGYNFGALRQSV